jgi:hypothetical protein
LEISDQADADRSEINFVILDMTSLQLMRPASASLNLSVSRVNPITYHKVVSESVLHPLSSMVFIINHSVAIFDGAVVDDNTFPIIGTHLNAGIYRANGRE